MKMAEKRQPVNNDVSETINDNSGPTCNTKWFTNFDIICIFVSMGSFVIDLSTDVILAAEYWRNDHLVWSLSTFLLVLIPAILIQLFSMRWHLMDEAVSLWHWIAHLCLLGLLHRYILLLKVVLDIRKSKSSNDIQKVYILHSDICMLHLFQAFLEAAPQFILQSYIMTVMRDWHVLTGVSAVASLCSLYWGVVGYMRALRKAREVSCATRSSSTTSMLSIALQVVWRSAMLAARLAALFMFAVAFKHWIFLLLSVHWFVMVIWIVHQKTDFCPTQSEEILYDCVVGVIYCFCFFNLRLGQARYRMMIFYSIMVLQNILCLLLFLFLAPGAIRKDIAIITSTIIICGTCLGIISILIYYRWLHPSGPLKWWNDGQTNSQPNPEAPADTVNASAIRPTNPRSLKTAWLNISDVPERKNDPFSPVEIPQSDTECTDKKHLLDHWIANAGSPTLAAVSAPVDNNDTSNVTGIEFYSVTNSPEKSNLNLSSCVTSLQEISNDKAMRKSKRRGICSPTELGVKFTKMEHNEASIDNVMTAQKRRGICSSGQLKEELVNEDNVNSVSDGKTSSESFHLDLDLSFSDINSSDINEFNENIVQKLCLSTLKNMKNVHQDADIRNIQKIALEILKDLYTKGGIKDEQDLESELSSSLGRDLETPSEALSAHDYENICAVNIAREAWGLRSWRACSDMGGSSPPPPPPPPLPQRRPIPPSPHHHYIRTVAYELAKCEETNCQLMKNTQYHKEPETVFLANPYVVDPNEGLFPITPLEPILEEIDDVADNGGTMRRRQRHGSESALVATIDEIRNDTVADSPRNVYHRGDWDSPCINLENNNHHKQDGIRKPSSLKKSLWSDVNNKYDRENVKKRVTISENPCIINDVVGEGVEWNTTHTRHKQYYTYKRTCNNPQAHIHKKIPNKIKETIPNPAATEVQHNNESSVEVHQSGEIISGSLKGLIEKDLHCVTNNKITADSRGVTKQRNNSNRPRRKFSLLREKFEPKSGHSDEEMLFQSMESVRSLSHNDLNVASSQSCIRNNIVLVNQEHKVKSDKENLTPKSKLPHSSDNGVVLSLTPCSLVEDTAVALRDKPTMFLKQVLSPPKINNWARRNISEYVN